MRRMHQTTIKFRKLDHKCLMFNTLQPNDHPLCILIVIFTIISKSWERQLIIQIGFYRKIRCKQNARFSNFVMCSLKACLKTNHVDIYRRQFSSKLLPFDSLNFPCWLFKWQMSLSPHSTLSAQLHRAIHEESGKIAFWRKGKGMR